MNYITSETLYMQSMGKLLKITAIFDDVDEANGYMLRHKDEGVIAQAGKLVFLANLYDKGVKLETEG